MNCIMPRSLEASAGDRRPDSRTAPMAPEIFSWSFRLFENDNALCEGSKHIVLQAKIVGAALQWDGLALRERPAQESEKSAQEPLPTASG